MIYTNKEEQRLGSFKFLFPRSPKSGSHSRLEEYRKAKQLGEEGGECWSEYGECPVSIFNIIPDVYTEEDRFNVTLDNFGMGSDVLDSLKAANIDVVPK